MAASRLSDEEHVAEIFRRVALNCDGSLDVEELHSLLARLDPHFDSAAVERLLDAAGVAGQSQIDVEQFLAWVFGGGSSSSSSMNRALRGRAGTAASFRPLSGVPGMQLQAASPEDADLTVQLVTDPAFAEDGSSGAELAGLVRTFTASAHLGAS